MPVMLFSLNSCGNATLRPVVAPQANIPLYDVQTAFLLGGSRNEVARQAWLQRYPYFTNPSYIQALEHGTIRILIPDQVQTAEKLHRSAIVRPVEKVPKFWATHLDNIFTPAQQLELGTAYNYLSTPPVQCRAHKKLDAEDRRHGLFARPTYHFGRWLRQRNPAIFSADTMQAGAILATQQQCQGVIT
ncbi:hypothetical protein M231_03040 [Tremella mesenterica]|uniref:Uncharacterized protein n=1 Tax=Tremella mesenterica TaxID=5217 RepID=A0A4Q1BP74_TREME|nr:hypothetical protein M231_03040 [Tremella mesenterica]